MVSGDVLFSEPLRIKLPESPLPFQSQTDAALLQLDAVAKARMKQCRQDATCCSFGFESGEHGPVLSKEGRESKPCQQPNLYKVITGNGKSQT